MARLCGSRLAFRLTEAPPQPDSRQGQSQQTQAARLRHRSGYFPVVTDNAVVLILAIFFHHLVQVCSSGFPLRYKKDIEPERDLQIGGRISDMQGRDPSPFSRPVQLLDQGGTALPGITKDLTVQRHTEQLRGGRVHHQMASSFIVDGGLATSRWAEGGEGGVVMNDRGGRKWSKKQQSEKRPVFHGDFLILDAPGHH